MTRDHETLLKAGESLYGSLWQSALASTLGVNLRTMQRWAAGTSAINPNIWPEIAALCAKRGKALQDLAKHLK